MGRFRGLLSRDGQLGLQRELLPVAPLVTLKSYGPVASMYQVNDTVPSAATGIAVQAPLT